mgnify:CR=1 FL=1
MSGQRKGLIMSVSGFVSRAACRGRRPAVFSSLVSKARPTLVARLLKDRGVARFVVAPSGYGKTCLAIEYAETVHSWAHVFWFNSQSPCFVRDLDAGTLASSCLALDPDAALVVFDDVSMLDPARQELFSSAIDDLLERGCEVVVTCVPACDFVGSMQRDRLCLTSKELLLDDMEFDDLRSAEERSRRPVESVGPAERVPLLAWSGASDRDDLFVRGALREELPSDLKLLIVSILVLRKGPLADLAPFSSFGERDLPEILSDYPHLGIDYDAGRFDAATPDVETLSSPLKRVIPQLIARSSFDTADELVWAWASTLMENAQPMRACALVREMCTRRTRAKWTSDNIAELVRRSCFFPVICLLSDREASRGKMRLRLDVFEALCRQILDDETGALRCAKRCAFSSEASDEAQVLGLLLVTRLDRGALAARARDALDERVPALQSKGLAACADWEVLAWGWHEGERGFSDLVAFWKDAEAAGKNEMVLCIVASWMFGKHPGGVELALDQLSTCREAEEFVAKRMSSFGSYGEVDFFVASAALSMEGARMRGMVLDGRGLNASSLMLLRQIEMGIASQRQLLVEKMKADQARRDDWIATHPSSLLMRESLGPTAAKERSVPLLSLKMFGCFEASIGGVPIEYSMFKRQNTRALLVLLAVNQGKELSRDLAVEALWPRSSHEVANKNFYTVWSSLRQALSLPDGTCPYLVRHRYGCSLDSRFVTSDVERLDEICRELLFGAPNVEQWGMLFSEIDRDFSCELMPAERHNPLIVKARRDYQARLVDALISATVSAVDDGNPRWGVWFARAAIARDETREDAYVALMRAQIAGNQRTAAMMTYLSCRRALSDQLGIDPSPETVALYESLLEGA